MPSTGADGRVLEVDLRLLLHALGLFDLRLAHGQFRLGDLVLRNGKLVFGLRDRPVEPLGPVEGELGLVAVRGILLDLGLGQPQTGEGLLQVELLGPVVQLGQDVAFLDAGIEVDGLAGPVGIGTEALDHAHDLGADVDDVHRFDAPRGSGAYREIAARDGQRAELRPIAAGADPPVAERSG